MRRKGHRGAQKRTVGTPAAPKVVFQENETVKNLPQGFFNGFSDHFDLQKRRLFRDGDLSEFDTFLKTAA